jgi:Ca2+-binding EF-hand superfamily protein
LGAAMPTMEVPSRAKRDEMFRQMDYNGNGALSLAEIDKAIVESYPEYNHKPALMRAYQAADKSGDGLIERREFAQLLHMLVFFNNVWHKFEEIDSDGDSRLDLEEFKSGCSVLGLDTAGMDAQTEFTSVAEAEGHVLFGEFCSWCARWHVGGLSDVDEQRVMDTSLPEDTMRAAVHQQPLHPQPAASHHAASPAPAVRPVARDQLAVPDKAKRDVMFRQMDYNGNGMLSLAEIDKFIKKSYHAYNHQSALIRAYQAADTSDDGFIERHEFAKLLHYLVYFNNLWHKFEQIDADGDRRLTHHEFLRGCRVVGIQLSQEASAEQFLKICEPGGHVLFGEFCSWCAQK